MDIRKFITMRVFSLQPSATSKKVPTKVPTDYPLFSLETAFLRASGVG